MKSLFKNLKAIANSYILGKTGRIHVGVFGTTGFLSLVTISQVAIAPKVSALPAYCSILYAIDNTGTNFSKIYNVDVTNAHYNAATADSGAGASNTLFLSAAAALEPSTGRLFYISRDTSSTKTAYWDPVNNTRTQLATTFNSSSVVVRAAFSPSGRLFAATSTTIYEIDSTTGAQISSKPLSGVSGTNGDMAFDGNNVLFLAADANLYTIDIDNLSASSPANLLATAPGGTTFNSLGFKPDGKLYAFAGSNSTMYEVNTNTGSLTTIGTITFNPSTTAGVVSTDYASCAAPIPNLQSTKTYTKVSGSTGSDILPGDVVEYTIKTINTGSVPATKATFKDPIPAGATYVAGSTTMNGTAVTDVFVGTFPFTNGATIKSAGLNSGVVGTGSTYQVTIKYRIQVNTVNPPTSVTNQGTTFYLGGLTDGVLTDDPNTPIPTDPTVTTITPATTTISGKVWDDADNSANNTFSNINTGSESGTNAGGLNAILVNSTGNVIATTAVAMNGTYIFSNVATNQTGVKILLSTTAGTIGLAAPAASVPANWTNTSQLTTAAFNILTTSIAGKDFGIEQLPNTTSLTATSQTNPGSTTRVQVPTFAGTDPEDGPLGSGKTFKIVTLPTNGTLYYNNTAVTAAQVITNYDPTKLTIDPNDGTIIVTFTYAAIDAAGKEDPTPAIVSMPFTAPITPTLSGKVWDDADNSANNTFSNINTGSESGTNAGSLNAVLVSSLGTVIASTPIAANGTYTFLNVSANLVGVTIRLSTTAGTIGASAPAASVPANWIGTSPLTTPAFNINISNIAGQDFGIEQLPNTNNVNATAQTNPGGTATVQVTTLAGTDPEDGALGTGKSFKIISLPTNGTLYYNNIAVTANQVVNSYDPTKLTLDPNDGAITVTFTVAAVDAAGKEDPTPATVTMPFDVTYQVSPLAGKVIINEVLYNETGATIAAETNDEFIELYNASSSPVDLSGLKLADGNLIANSTDTGGFSYTFPNGTTLQSGQYAVIWIGNKDSIGNHKATGAAFEAWLSQTTKLQNSGDDIWLYDNQNQIIDYIAYGTASGINTPPSSSLNLWNSTYQSFLAGASNGQSISLTGNGKDTNTSGCWEATTSGNASASTRCPNYLPTIDIDSTGSRVTSVGKNNNGVTAKLVLVKRITRINNQDLIFFVNGRSSVSTSDADYVPEPYASDDDDSKWPSSYLRGLINAGTVKPGDELEYTIYFLSKGLGDATNVNLCDLVPASTTFLATAFNGMAPRDGGLSGGDQGIALAVGSTTPTAYLSNVADGDRGRFYAANDPTTPSYCGTNTNGAVLVNITRSPDLPNLPTATQAVQPANSYGFVRFRAKVK